MSFLELEALPPALRDLTHSCLPMLVPAGGRCPPCLVLAPESALRLHPCRALPSAPVSISLEKAPPLGKLVVVVHREE